METLTNLLHQMADDAAALFAISDSRVVIVRANSVVADRLRVKPEQLIGGAVTDLVPGPRGAEYARVMAEVVRDGRERYFLAMHAGAVYRAIFRRVNLDSDRKGCLSVAVPLCRVTDTQWSRGVTVEVFSEHDFGALAAMTLREIEVYRMLGQSKSVPEIARLLHRSARTIETHRESIGQKLGVTGRVALALHSSESGLTHLTDAQFELLMNGRRSVANPAAPIEDGEL